MQKGSKTVSRSRDADSLRAAMGREGCPVCTVVLESIERYMDTWQYEGFTDVEQRHQLIVSRGFCPLHTWQLAQRHNALQLALVYREVLTDLLADLEADQKKSRTARERKSGSDSPWSSLRRRRGSPAKTMPAGQNCPLCRVRADAEQRLLETLLEQLQVEEVRALLSQSTGLCLLHFNQARSLAESRKPELLPYLLDCQRSCMQRVLGEVQELIRKHDYRFAKELQGNEMTSWRRAAELCAGNPGVR
jgi:hypothetical protein